MLLSPRSTHPNIICKTILSSPYQKPAFLLLASFSLFIPSGLASSNPPFSSAFLFNPSLLDKRNYHMTTEQPAFGIGDSVSIAMAKRDSPSAQRNKEPIWNILSSKVIPSLEGTNNSPLRILEIAAGCGVHSHHFALNLLNHNNNIPFHWYPTDPDDASRESIQAYIQDEPNLQQNVHVPLELTLDENGVIPTDENQLVRDTTFQLMICINMIHISPWSATQGLMKFAGEKLSSGGILYLYGPYKKDGKSAESNL